MSLKLDISKTYDRVELSFLEKLMHKMGFENARIRSVMMYVKSVSFSILINGELKGLVKLSRGLGQRNPLFPYLFFLCTEGLISLLYQTTIRQLLTGIKICRRALSIYHILFADDNILFFKIEMTENRKVMKLLELYEQASSQQINKSKTSMSFSRNEKPMLKCRIKKILRECEGLETRIISWFSSNG